MKKYKLDLGSETYFSDYNPKLDATLFHYFATAAYRFGHTLLNGLIRLVKGFKDVGSYLVRDNYFNSTQVRNLISLFKFSMQHSKLLVDFFNRLNKMMGMN